MLKVIRLLTNLEFDKYLKLKESERSGAKAKKYIDSLELFEKEHDRSGNRSIKSTKDRNIS